MIGETTGLVQMKQTFGLTAKGATAIYGIIAACVAAGKITVKYALIVAGCTTVAGLLLATLFSVGVALIVKKFKLGKNVFTAW